MKYFFPLKIIQDEIWISKVDFEFEVKVISFWPINNIKYISFSSICDGYIWRLPLNEFLQRFEKYEKI